YPEQAGAVATATVDDVTTLTWTPSDAVLDVAGNGTVVIHCTENDVEKRSAMTSYYVALGHAAAGDPPEPLADYVQKWSAVDATVTESVPGTAPTAAVTQDNTGTHFVFDLPTDLAADASATTLDTGLPATAAVTQDGTGAHFVFGLPRGLTGAQGIQGLTGNGIDNIARTSGDGSPGTTDTYTVAFTDTSTTTFDVYNGANGDITGVTVDGAEVVPAAGVVDLTDTFSRYALWRKTTSGNPVSVYPVPESPLYPKVSGTFTQEGTSDPSPENVRPITPWLASGGTVKIKRMGKNLLPNKFHSLLGEGQVYSVPTNELTITAQSGYASIWAWLKAGTYTLSKSSEYYFTANRIASPDVATAVIGKQLSYTFTTVKDGWVGIGLERDVSPGGADIPFGAGALPSTFSMQLELGSVATAYEPYAPVTEITLTAPQEIPAGWMDNEAVGAVTGIKTTLNATEIWDDANFAASGYFETTLAVAAHGTPALACSHFLPATSAAADSNKVIISGTSLKIYPDDAVATDKTEWLAYLAASPVTIAYTRATPVNITPTSAPLTALPQLDRVTPRSNVLTASTGNVELTYAKSPIQESTDVAAAIAVV
ncbi:MAG: hypothetical protein PHX74_11905, partial [Candidatus Sumerlaeales bacterium]|nr:hypothetical protein [Candidatus Sumerlaeales bacterium]